MKSIVIPCNITLLTKVHIVKVTVFPVVMYGLKNFLVVLGLRCWSGFSLDAVSRGCSLVEMRGLLTEVVPLTVEHRL